jgi:hypothetical protein
LWKGICLRLEEDEGYRLRHTAGLQQRAGIVRGQGQLKVVRGPGDEFKSKKLPGGGFARVRFYGLSVVQPSCSYCFDQDDVLNRNIFSDG